MSSGRVAVLGGGVMGLASAAALIGRGFETTLFERRTLGHDRGSSWGSVRIFRLAYAEPKYVSAAQRARELWREVEDRVGEALITDCGGVDFGDPHELVAIQRAFDAVDVSYQVMDKNDARRRWPDINFNEDVLFQPQAGVIKAKRAMMALGEQVEAGARVSEGQAVSSISSENGKVIVTTQNGRQEFDAAVLAVGSWTMSLTQDLLPSAKLRVRDEFPFEFNVPAAASAPIGIHHTQAGIPASGFYWLPVDAKAMKVAAHSSGPILDDPNERVELCPGPITETVTDYVKQIFVGASPVPRAPNKGCLYDLTSDENFIITEQDHIVVLAGFSGHGFKFAPLVGEVAADLVEGRSQALEVFPAASCLQQ